LFEFLPISSTGEFSTHPRYLVARGRGRGKKGRGRKITSLGPVISTALTFGNKGFKRKEERGKKKKELGSVSFISTIGLSTRERKRKRGKEEGTGKIDRSWVFPKGEGAEEKKEEDSTSLGTPAPIRTTRGKKKGKNKKGGAPS